MNHTHTIHMRSLTTHGTDTQQIMVHPGQIPREEGKRIAAGYGAKLLAVEPNAIQPPELDHDAYMLKRFHQQVIPRGKIERRVMANLLNYLMANGFTPVELADGSDEAEKVCDIKSTMELAFNLDECHIYFDYNNSGKPKHWIFFVFGNDGPDIVNDYGCPKEDHDGWNTVMDLFNPDDYV